MERRPALGYLLAASAAILWSLNGSLARFLLDDGLGAERLSQLRSLGSWLILVIALALLRPKLLRVERREIPALVFVGIAGLAFVHALYFVAIDRLQIGVALTIQYLAPLLILLWLRLAHGRRLAPALWGAVALSVLGCFFVVRAYEIDAVDGLGLLAALGSAVTFAIYIVGSERAGHRHEPVTTLVWAFGFATLFWALAAPWWSFPWEELGSLRNLALVAYVIVLGTLVPFVCMVAALRHVPAPRAAVVATLEPVLAAVLAWAIHDEKLAAVQLAGGAAVLLGVVWVQTHRPDVGAEAAPPLRAVR
ncbi:MAG: EamA family transporter [Thermoleophilaceae bacterium]|nr:EamA family transporter [Thermoleophilaceae bacterium]